MFSQGPYFLKLVFKNYFLFFNLKTVLKTNFKKHGQTGLCFPFIFKKQ